MYIENIHDDSFANDLIIKDLYQAVKSILADFSSSLGAGTLIATLCYVPAESRGWTPPIASSLMGAGATSVGIRCHRAPR